MWRDTMRRPLPMTNLEAELARLEAMDAATLRREFTARRGQPAPATASGRFLRHFLAYDLQLAAHGGEPKRVAREYARIGGALAAGLDPEAALRGSNAPSPIRLTPGAKLLRDYGDRTHEVMVLEDGFAWAGRRWRSLSTIAREITGQRRNGPAFFGLAQAVAKSGQGRGPHP